jgi:hypothetical protein
LGVENGHNGEKEDIAFIHPTKKLNPLDMCYPISVKTAYVEGKVRSPKKFKKYASEYYLLNVKRIHKNYTPFL